MVHYLEDWLVSSLLITSTSILAPLLQQSTSRASHHVDLRRLSEAVLVVWPGLAAFGLT